MLGHAQVRAQLAEQVREPARGGTSHLAVLDVPEAVFWEGMVHQELDSDELNKHLGVVTHERLDQSLFERAREGPGKKKAAPTSVVLPALWLFLVTPCSSGCCTACSC